MKEKYVYICENCGYESPKWFGRCPVCGKWDSAKKVAINVGGDIPHVDLIKLSSSDVKMKRLKTGYKVLDEILGGGFVEGQVVLLGGEPGVGKSTLALQISESMSDGSEVIYASGEESIEQLSMRAKRVGVIGEGIFVSTEQNVSALFKTVEEKSPVLVILDSIQTFYSDELETTPGGISQLRAVVSKAVEFAKRSGSVVLLIGHVTKSGDIAGPKVVEHMVDTVIYFEGEKITDYRIIRVFKNRFGPSGGIAVFEMTGKGLKAVENPVFVDNSVLPGNALACVIEGNRAMVVQIQALVSKSKMPSPRRNSVGLDANRLNSIVAVMSKKLKIPLDLHEIYVGVLGGMRITDPGVDLAVSMAIFSSFLEKSLESKVAMGELGLDGRVRIPYGLKKRLDALSKVGFKDLILPVDVKGFNVVKVESITEVMKVFER